MYQKFLTGAAVFGGLFLFTIATIGISLQACSPGQLHQEEVEPHDTIISLPTKERPPNGCDDPWKHSVAMCVFDGEEITWQGYADECFNLACQTSWTPALGIMCIRCTWPLCEDGFRWRKNDHCPVPMEYLWEVSETYDPQQGQFWEGKLTFPPSECLAEEVNNCHYFNIQGYGCPY